MSVGSFIYKIYSYIFDVNKYISCDCLRKIRNLPGVTLFLGIRREGGGECSVRGEWGSVRVQEQ